MKNYMKDLFQYLFGTSGPTKKTEPNDKDAILKVSYVRCMDEFAVFNLN